MNNYAGDILITNPVAAAVCARLADYGRVVANQTPLPWDAAALAERLSRASAMMGFMNDRVDARLLSAAPFLRVIACALKGYDSYDIDACTRAGVWLTVVPDLLTTPTAELALGLAIALARNVRAGDRLVRSGGFSGWRAQLYGVGLDGATVAVIGLGRVGEAVVSRLRGFGCARILGIDPAKRLPGVETVELLAGLAQAQFVFLAVPLTPESHHLLDAGALRHCRRGQIIVNVGRGSVVDEEAIADILTEGLLGGYAADVFACEDWALPDRPRAVCPRLLECENTLLTPHLGSAVAEVRLAIEHRAAENIIAALTGEVPPDAVNSPRPCSSAVRLP